MQRRIMRWYHEKREKIPSDNREVFRTYEAFCRHLFVDPLDEVKSYCLFRNDAKGGKNYVIRWRKSRFKANKKIRSSDWNPRTRPGRALSCWHDIKIKRANIAGRRTAITYYTILISTFALRALINSTSCQREWTSMLFSLVLSIWSQQYWDQ